MSDATGLRARWVLVRRGNKAELMDNATVVVDGTRIVAILSEGAEGTPECTIDLSQHLLMPGFLNTHTHCVSGPLFRAILEDRDIGDGGSLIRDVMLPLGEIVSELCDEDDIRAWLHPYLMSGQGAIWSLGDDTTGRPTDDAALATFRRWHARFDEGQGGRIRIGLGPHAPDTCAPALLRAVAHARDAYGAPVTIHLAQSTEEMATIPERLGLSPVQYLDAVGLLQPGLIAAHCVHAGAEDLDLLATRGVTVAHCPLSFARIATLAPRSRFVRHCVRTTIGSDAHALDIVADLRLAAINSKYETGDPGAASAWEMVEAATALAADALGRDDLGRIAVGAMADLIAVRMNRAHLQPVFDPVKALVWNGTGQDVDFAMVDGEQLITGGRLQRSMNEVSIVAQASAVLSRVWERARNLRVI